MEVDDDYRKFVEWLEILWEITNKTTMKNALNPAWLFDKGIVFHSFISLNFDLKNVFSC